MTLIERVRTAIAKGIPVSLDVTFFEPSLMRELIEVAVEHGTRLTLRNCGNLSSELVDQVIESGYGCVELEF